MTVDRPARPATPRPPAAPAASATSPAPPAASVPPGGGDLVVGLIVNPVAGIGGPAGLKGSDGPDVQREALARGASLRAGDRAAQAVRTLLARRPGTRIRTLAGPMGEHSARAAGADPELLRLLPGDPSSPRDTTAAVAAMKDVDLLLFAGGDGTARDVLDGSPSCPVLGVPAGVKVYSGCFALSPATAGAAAAEFGGETAEAEVVDLDEEAYRRGRVGPRLYGTLRVPAARTRLSGRKVGSSSAAPGSAEGIAREVVARMRPGARYVLGPGATTMAVGRRLGLATTLLGVDVVQDGELVAADVTERQLADLVDGRESHAVVSVIGGQGFVLGRGNQQISPAVLKKIMASGGLVVLATQQKLAGLGGRPLLADTGDPQADALVGGHVSVITGYRESAMYRIRSAIEEFSA
ncbi:Predicted polyphosphate-or ATP-dependent NAD kinase [Streptosporangium canum]|uniref:Predicted polyphosphate-or ATP-dependent NAD kinase n=1 Tax=Streptosporangium canum TaxID=324952 RepID=A0A1I4BMQ4_9ACTN|nr:NAD(+)/NADH kinase [Streptosporangium canum]SFK69843.1 Predicted polyphosphate-or ATP-dependent NAD kinase [Streptosporangium canum]